jgi:hypothetical protein
MITSLLVKKANHGFNLKVKESLVDIFGVELLKNDQKVKANHATISKKKTRKKSRITKCIRLHGFKDSRL